MNTNHQNPASFFSNSRMEHLIETFARIGADPAGGISRLAFSKEDKAARDLFCDMVKKELNLEVRMDAAGNLFALRQGSRPDLPVIMAGSHLDSVRNGGKYDGPAGVFCAFEAFRALDLAGIQTRHPFELCVMTSEEPNTFGISTFGSQIVTGKTTADMLRPLKDAKGTLIGDAVKTIGIDLESVEDAKIGPDRIKHFVELHIEQMPFLERENKDIGVVEGVTAIYREAVTIEGKAGHCGTTPMADRKDALCAAAEFVLAVESAAAEEDGRAVATVGTLNVFPNAINIIPGRVRLNFEIRTFYPDSLETIKSKINTGVKDLKKKRGVAVERRVDYNKPITKFDPQVIRAISRACDKLGLSYMNQASMAGHDAAHMGSISKAGMIFIPCKGGLSHCPEEFTTTDQLVKGAQCLLEALLILDNPN